MKNENQIKLFEISQYSKERIDNATLDSSTYVGVDNLLPNKEGIKAAEIYPDSGKSIKYESGDILIGNIRPYLRKIWLANNTGGTNGDVLVIHITQKDSILPEYLYYVLSSEDFFKYMIQHSRGGKMPRGDKKKVLNYSLNLPSIEKQIRIINILNSFKDLISTLKAELKLREKQFKYYLKTSFEKLQDIQKAKLRDIILVKRGKQINKDQLVSTGKFPYINGGIDPSGFTEEYNFPESSITISEGGASAGYVNYINSKFWAGSDCFVIENKSDSLDYLYIYYFLKNKQNRLMTMKHGAGIPHLSRNVILSLEIPEASKEIQEKLISFFESLTSLISNLKQEIELRQKQYEYYRDKLLDFGEEDE